MAGNARADGVVAAGAPADEAPLPVGVSGVKSRAGVARVALAAGGVAEAGVLEANMRLSRMRAAGEAASAGAAHPIAAPLEGGTETGKTLGGALMVASPPVGSADAGVDTEAPTDVDRAGPTDVDAAGPAGVDADEFEASQALDDLNAGMARELEAVVAAPDEKGGQLGAVDALANPRDEPGGPSVAPVVSGADSSETSAAFVPKPTGSGGGGGAPFRSTERK